MSCSYAAPGSRKKQSSSSSSTNSPDGMQDRIDRLEGLVLSLMTNGAQSAGPAAAQRALSMSESSSSLSYPPDMERDGDFGNSPNGPIKMDGEEGESETDQVAQSLGVMKVDNTKSMYFGDSHWAAILKDISELKNYFSEHKKLYEDQAAKVEAANDKKDSGQGLHYLFGGGRTPVFVDLLSALPERSITDRLVSRYFNSYDPAVHILHPPSWYRMYNRHWEDPQATSPAWLGQIFAVMCLAMHTYHRIGDEPPEYQGQSLQLASHYSSLTGQCLLLADFLKPVNHMIETLVLHLHGQYARHRDTDVGVWVLVGMIARLAMRMGYHRDPKYYPNITPFQGEIRRRVWTFVRQSDLLFSFQIGLPSMIRLGDCDTELPRNIFDDEFDENVKVLPPSRPFTEATPVSYMRAKATMAFAFGKVIERVHAVTPSSYEELMALDELLRATRAEYPPHLRLRSIQDSMMDPGALVIQRINLAMLYHKGQCVLHRKFLARARENSRYAQSRRTCVDSSMELLNHQATLHYESKPGRRLHGMKLFTSSLTSHDFLLAAMIICLDLWYGAEAEGAGRSSADLYTWGLERRADMIRALEISAEIWGETRDQSMEAFKASELITVMLKKLKSPNNPGGRQPQSPFPFPGMGMCGSAANTYSSSQVEEKPEHSAAMTLGMLSNGGMTPNTANMFNSGYPPVPGTTSEQQKANLAVPNFSLGESANGTASAPSPLSFMGGDAVNAQATNIDWEAWDSYIQNTGIDGLNSTWPMQMDIPMIAPGLDGQGQQSQMQPGSNVFGTTGGVFMGSDIGGGMPM